MAKTKGKLTSEQKGLAHLEDFVKKSQKITGIRLSAVNKTWKKRGLSRLEHEAEMVRLETITKRHLEMAVRLSQTKTLQDPKIIHHGLFYQIEHHAGYLRTSVPGALHGQIPLGEYVPKLLKLWNKECMRFAKNFESMRSQERVENTQNLRYTFLCISPFIGGNGRTSRLIENHLRCICGLEWKIFTYQASHSDMKNLAMYRKKVFLPSHKKYCS